LLAENTTKTSAETTSFYLMCCFVGSASDRLAQLAQGTATSQGAAAEKKALEAAVVKIQVREKTGQLSPIL
jgi:hypothetical protein